MIIGFDGSRAFVKVKTGTENYSFQLLKALAKIDRKNRYIVYLRPTSVIPAKAGIHLIKSRSELDPDIRRDDKKKVGYDEEKWPKNFKFVEISWPRLWTQGGLARQTFRDKLDVLFIPAHTAPLIHKPGLKTVVTVHDLGSEYLPKMHQLKQQLYLKYITKYQLRSATKLIAVSKATKEDLLKKAGVDEKKIEVVYEGFDQKLFKPARNASTSVAGGPTIPDALVTSLKQYYLFVGTIQPRKNLERLIKAFAIYSSNEVRSYHKNINILKVSSRMHSNNNLVIVGQKGWLSEDIYKLPKKLGIEERVKFLGYVPDEKMPALYSNALALVFPSLFEGFGLPILEAQACGCPVITSNTSSMPEIAGKGAILVDPYSVDDIVSGMSRIMNHELRIKLIKAGFENVKRFSWEKCARETLRVLESV